MESPSKLTMSLLIVILLGGINSASASSTLPSGWQNGYTPYVYIGGAPDYRGEPALAYVDTGSSKIVYQPNQVGVFPRVQVAQGATVQVILEFPQAPPGERIRLTALDGGAIDKNHDAEALKLDDASTVSFSFTLSPNRGISKVGIDIKGQSLCLEFWGGSNLKSIQSAVKK